MCGIAGFWQPNGFSEDAARAIAKEMADRIVHRGPDDFGVWVDKGVGIALAHRRLSILELSLAGHQPMLSSSGRYVIIFNGEIYNHLELREDLMKLERFSEAGKRWRGHSDTETILEGFEAWGIEAALKKTVGMFAIALWDRKERILTLARDRMGEKPIYYGFQKNTLIFGSELKAVIMHPDFTGEIDRDALCLYLRHCYIPAPYSIYNGIQKLLPGNYIQFPIERGLAFLRSVKPSSYWSMDEVVEKGMSRPFTGSDADAIDLLERQLKRAIGLQMIADVPLGAFLSGGVDSSAVTALMQAQSSCPVKTFSIGFNESGYNEAGHAKVVAQHLGTDHTEHYVSSSETMDVIPQLGKMYDEPFADSSQIPTFLVSRMARRHVTVSLSGDAGDELFCGYNRYVLADIWKKFANIPFGARKSAGNLLKIIGTSPLFRYAGKLLAFPSIIFEKVDKLAQRLETVDDIKALYYSLVSMIADPDRVVIGAKEPGTWLTETGMKSQFPDFKLQMMYMDCMTYLPDDILVKVDRAAMFNSLETRIPYLDHRVIELAWSLPLSMKIRNGRTKWLLRQVLYKYVPKDLIERPKMGFGVPIGNWLRGPLEDWAEDLLDESRLRREGFFDAQSIRFRWQEHLTGKRNSQYFIWSVLIFQEWLEEQKRHKHLRSLNGIIG